MKFAGWFVKRSIWRDPIQFLTIIVFTNCSEFIVCWPRRIQMQQILIWLAIAYNKLYKPMSSAIFDNQCVAFGDAGDNAWRRGSANRFPSSNVIGSTMGCGRFLSFISGYWNI